LKEEEKMGTFETSFDVLNEGEIWSK